MDNLPLGPKRIRLKGMAASLWLPQDMSHPCALIMVSHGAGGSRIDHRGTAELLAARGFVVCAIEHEGDNFRNKKLLGKQAYWSRRPKQLSDALEALLNHSEFGKLIDTQRIGALGFSAGGYTVLAAAGAQPDYDLLAKHMQCPEEDPRFCGYGSGAREDATQSEIIDDLFVTPLLKSIIAVAPVGALFNNRSFDAVKAKLCIYRAGKDQILLNPFHAENIHNNLKMDHDYHVIENLHHFGFIEPFPWYLKLFGVEASKDPAGFDRRSFLNGFNPKISKYFLETL